MARIILHFDLDAFYCAVEEQFNSDLIGKAFAVGGEAGNRGVVASCSYPARLFGVRSAMPMSQARRLCPELIVVSTRHAMYGEWSKKVMAHLHNLTPLVEKLSIDEAFLDVTGIKGGGEAIAKQVQMTIRSKIGLPCSLGIASNKLVAKIANNLGKVRKKDGTPPCAIEVVPDGEEAQYLAPLAIRELWGVGPKTAESMYALNIHTISDIAHQKEQFMIHHFGKNGYDMWRHARGIDNRAVEPEQEMKSISNEITFNKDVRDGDELLRVLRNLGENVGRRLRKSKISGRTISIKLRWSDFTTLSRQMTLQYATQDDAVIVREAIRLFEANWTAGRPVRLIGVGVNNLEDNTKQLSLWESPQDEKSRKLQTTLDELKQRFGDSMIKRGSNMKK